MTEFLRFWDLTSAKAVGGMLMKLTLGLQHGDEMQKSNKDATISLIDKQHMDKIIMKLQIYAYSKFYSINSSNFPLK